MFDQLNASCVDFHVTCSYLELYKEELADLLVNNDTSDNNNNKITILQSKQGGIECHGLSQHPVQSADEILQLMKQAQEKRHVSETQMNKRSSRSHCIFTMKITTRQRQNDASADDQEEEWVETHGKLHLVDLAGSESAKTATLKTSGAREQAAREQERRSINKSLLTLGRVITCLKQQSQNGVVPYR